jgi:hypothetical protein
MVAQYRVSVAKQQLAIAEVESGFPCERRQGSSEVGIVLTLNVWPTSSRVRGCSPSVPPGLD